MPYFPHSLYISNPSINRPHHQFPGHTLYISKITCTHTYINIPHDDSIFLPRCTFLGRLKNPFHQFRIYNFTPFSKKKKFSRIFPFNINVGLIKPFWRFLVYKQTNRQTSKVFKGIQYTGIQNTTKRWVFTVDLQIFFNNNT